MKYDTFTPRNAAWTRDQIERLFEDHLSYSKIQLYLADPNGLTDDECQQFVNVHYDLVCEGVKEDEIYKYDGELVDQIITNRKLANEVQKAVDAVDWED